MGADRTVEKKQRKKVLPTSVMGSERRLKKRSTVSKSDNCIFVPMALRKDFREACSDQAGSRKSSTQLNIPSLTAMKKLGGVLRVKAEAKELRSAWGKGIDKVDIREAERVERVAEHIDPTSPQGFGPLASRNVVFDSTVEDALALNWDSDSASPD